MRFKEAEGAIRGFLNTHWNNRTPISWPDVNFNKPNAGTWLRFSMKNNAGRQVTMGTPGANVFRRTGIITIQVFRKINKIAPEGTTVIRDDADDVADIFILQRLSGFRFRNVNAREVGADKFGWYQFNVTIEYDYDRIT